MCVQFNLTVLPVTGCCCSLSLHLLSIEMTQETKPEIKKEPDEQEDQDVKSSQVVLPEFDDAGGFCYLLLCVLLSVCV